MGLVNWERVYVRLFALIDRNEPKACYYSGPKFLDVVRQFDPGLPYYQAVIDDLNRRHKSTTRRDYFHDIFLSYEPAVRTRIVNAILDELASECPDDVDGVRSEMGGIPSVTLPTVPPDIWNAERLGNYLADMESRIQTGNFEGAVTLAYTCLEGCLKAYIQQHVPGPLESDELNRMAKIVQRHLCTAHADFPQEAFRVIAQIAHPVGRLRNRHSESHFDQPASRALADLTRDLSAAAIRLILNFI